VDPNSGMSQPLCQMPNMSTRVRAGQTDRITVTCYGPLSSRAIQFAGSTITAHSAHDRHRAEPR
jgi:hypothetical protein